jgi:hypothetical protein
MTMDLDTPKPPETDKPASDLAAEAESSGKLKPLEDVMTEMGWPIPAGEMLLLAQKDERTRGKSPEEIAGMLREDTSLYADLEAYQPGGKLDKPPAVEDDPEPSEDEESAAGDFFGKSASMKDGDKKKGAKALKKVGGKLDDFDAKADFMRDMAREE